MDIAIHLEKINLRDDRFLFKPVGVIKGTYIEEAESFESECGIVCESINCGSGDSDDYFDSPTTIDELRQKFGDVVEEQDLLAEFLDIAVNTLYVGYYDYNRGCLEVKKIPFESFEDQEEFPMISAEDIDDVNDTIFRFNYTGLKELRDSKTIEEVRHHIDQIMSVAGKIEVNEESVRKTTKNQPKLQKEESKKFDLLKLRKDVKSSIVGQDKAVDDLTRTIVKNYTSINPKNKDHMLIIGPSGTGKTEMVNIISKILQVPVFKANAPDYTKSGYQGKEVNSMIAGLISAAKGDINLAQNGILIIDEIDKKAGTTSTREGDFDRAVLDSLLKIMDRDIIEVDLDLYSKKMFDTSNLTVVLMGSFDKLYRQKLESKKYEKKTVGFNSIGTQENFKIEERVTEDDLIKWLGAETIGRIGKITSTTKITFEDAMKILCDSKISQLNILREDLKNRGIKLYCSYGYKKEIVKKGISDDTGVRNLNKIVKDSVDYAYDDILTKEGVKVLKLTKATALDPRKYFLE